MAVTTEPARRAHGVLSGKRWLAVHVRDSHSGNAAIRTVAAAERAGSGGWVCSAGWGGWACSCAPDGHGGAPGDGTDGCGATAA